MTEFKQGDIVEFTDEDGNVRRGTITGDRIDGGLGVGVARKKVAYWDASDLRHISAVERLAKLDSETRVGKRAFSAKRLGSDDSFGWLFADEYGDGTKLSLGHIRFENADEVKAAIHELKKLLPAVDRLAEVIDD